MSRAPRPPLYQKIAGDLRSGITHGTYPLGAALPSTARLMAHYGVSLTVARAAIKELQAAGIARGQPGKGVYVIAHPAPPPLCPEVAVLSQDIEALHDELTTAITRLTDRSPPLEQSLRTGTTDITHSDA